jgi:hypothetical protein
MGVRGIYQKKKITENNMRYVNLAFIYDQTHTINRKFQTLARFDIFQRSSIALTIEDQTSNDNTLF